MFAKVFQSLWQGSLVGRSDAQLVFIFLLANADSTGEADYFPPVISALTGIPEDRVLAALAELESVDDKSRSPEEDGRRITRLDEHRDWGWRIVNYSKYRDIRDAETRRRQVRESVRRYRAKKSAVSDVGHGEPQKAQAEVEAEVEVDSIESATQTLTSAAAEAKPRKRVAKEKKAPDDWDDAFERYFWPEYPRKVDRLGAKRAWAKLKDPHPARWQETLERIVSGLKDSAKAWQDENRTPDLIPHAATWLNHHRWEDQPL